MAALCWRIHKLDTTASTNDDARRAAESGAGEGYVVIAVRQTAGRGRYDRVWDSPAGNLYASVLLQPKDMPQSASLYSFVAALAVSDVVANVVPQADIKLKWPNDVLVDGRKISGILLEVIGQTLVVGIGINVAQHPDAALYPATSLAGEGATHSDLDALLDCILARLGHWHDVIQTGGFAPIRAAWLARAQTGRLHVRLPQGILQGDFAGLDEYGGLRLLLADGTERTIVAGDIIMCAER